MYPLRAETGPRGFRSACSITDFSNKESNDCNVASTSAIWAPARLRAASRNWSLKLREHHNLSFAKPGSKRPLGRPCRSLDRGGPEQVSGTTVHAQNELELPTPIEFVNSRSVNPTKRPVCSSELSGFRGNVNPSGSGHQTKAVPDQADDTLVQRSPVGTGWIRTRRIVVVLGQQLRTRRLALW